MLHELLDQKYTFFRGTSELNNEADGNQKWEAIIRKMTNYYTMILTKKKKCSFISSSLVNFDNSKMDRNLLKVYFQFGKAVICVMNTHLESLRQYQYSKIRKEQLKLCFEHVQQEKENLMVIFGGDLNLRDKEVNFLDGKFFD